MQPTETYADGRCKAYRKLINQRNNGRNNAISKIAHRLAGGVPAYKKMGTEDRLHFRSLAAELFEAGATFETAIQAEKTRRDGFLYIIAHPMLSGLKIGRAFNPESRLNSYQTGCPKREYFLAYVGDYFEDCVTQEKRVHSQLANARLEGEWFDVTLEDAIESINAQSPFIAAA